MFLNCAEHIYCVISSIISIPLEAPLVLTLILDGIYIVIGAEITHLQVLYPGVYSLPITVTVNIYSYIYIYIYMYIYI